MTRVARSWDRTRFINAWYAHNNADYTVLIDVAYPSSYVSRCFNLFDFSSIKSTTKYDIINFSFSMNSFSIISQRFFKRMGKNNLNILYYKYFLLIIYIFIITFFFNLFHYSIYMNEFILKRVFVIRLLHDMQKYDLFVLIAFHVWKMKRKLGNREKK